METDVLVMGGLTILMVVWAFTRGKDLPLRGVQAGLGLLQEVWLPPLFGFCMAGLFEVLTSWELLATWMDARSPAFRASCSGGWRHADAHRDVCCLLRGSLALKGSQEGRPPLQSRSGYLRGTGSDTQTIDSG